MAEEKKNKSISPQESSEKTESSSSTEKPITDTKVIEKTEKEIAKDITKTEEKVEEHKITQKQADKEIKQEVKEDIEKEQKDIGKKESKKKVEKEQKSTKTEAVVNAQGSPISTKHSIAICNLIRGKDIDKAISILELAEQRKIAVPMRGEIPHRKGMMSGRYPIKAVKEFIKLLKSLKANAIVNELELEKYVIFCKSNVAPRPHRRFGRTRFKRTHVTLKLILPVKKKKKHRTHKESSEHKERLSSKKLNITKENTK